MVLRFFRHKAWLIVILTLMQVCFPAFGGFARSGPMGCDAAASFAAAQTGVPQDVLMAITRAEAGRNIGGRLTPWPWAVNQAGAGSWFDSRAQAADHVETAIANGATNIDIGCFQLNWRWHGAAFASVDAMFDPAANALYAAAFLQRLYRELGDWDAAIGAYHSRHPDAAEGYLSRVSDLLAAPAFTNDQGDTAAPRENRFPLLQYGSGASGGSLVATDRQASPLFEAAARPLLR